MISAIDLLAMKARMIKAATAAARIASSADPVFYDQEEYEAVHVALASLKSDISRTLAELDVLRGIFYSGVSLFLMEGSSDAGVSVSGGDVVAVSDQKAGDGGEGEHAVSQGADGGVPTSGVRRKRAKRSKSRRDRKGNVAAEETVGPVD